MKLSIYPLVIIPLFVLMGCGSVDTTQEVNKTIVSVELDENNSRPLVVVEEEEQPEPPHEIIPMEEENISVPTPMLETVVTPVEVEVEEEAVMPTPTPIPLTYTQKFINDQNCDQIIDKEFLIICYDQERKVAKGVSYTLDGDLMNELNIQERPSFYEEESIAEPYRAKLADYRGSGYDRGHLAPDAAFDWSQESLDATYSLANIIPQVPTVNQRMWVDVEGYARNKALDLGELDVVNVISYANSILSIGEGNVSVSTGYYKILYNKEASYEECFYYANNVDANSTGDTLMSHLVVCGTIGNN